MVAGFGFGEACALGCAATWAVSVILFKKSGESLPPFALNYVKNLIALAAMAATLAALGSRAWTGLSQGELALVLVSGALGIGLADTMFFAALNRIGAARMGVASTVYSPALILLAAVFLGERLNLGQLGGVALTVAGILLVNYQHAADDLDAAALRRGALLGVTSLVVMAAGVVMVQPLLQTKDFLWLVTLRIAGGVLAMSVQLAWQRGVPRLVAELRAVRHWPHIVAGALMGAYVSNLLWLAGFKYANVTVAAVLNELNSVFIVLLAAWLFRDRLRGRQLVGCVVAVAGVLLVVLAR